MGARPSPKARSSRQRATKADPREELAAWAEDAQVELLFFDPPEYFDHAILGICTGYGQEPAVLYDQQKIIGAMAEDMGWEQAEEWFEFNTIGAYLGPATPRFLTKP